MEIINVGILEPLEFSESVINLLSSYATVELFDGNNIKKFVQDKHVIFTRLKYEINDELLKNSPNLLYVCSPTTGLNHITANNRSIHIISLKGEDEFLSTIRATAEHIFGLTIALLRNYKKCFIETTNKNWNRDIYKGYELYQRSIGVIGMGRIGKILSKYFDAFDSIVNYYDIDDKVNCLIDANEKQTIEELIEDSSIIILCANYSLQNDKFFDKKYFSLLDKKYFINASRGELVNEEDLLEFIETGNYLGIALDVLSNESDDKSQIKKFLDASKNKNVIITPHIGGATFTSMNRTEEFIAKKLIVELQRLK